MQLIRLFLIGLACLASGCTQSRYLAKNQFGMSRMGALDELLTDKDVIRRVQEVQVDLPTDTWIEGPSSRPGRNNNSRSYREITLAYELLDRLKPKLKEMPVHQLFESLKTFPPSEPGTFPGVAYYVYRDGNNVIIDELSKRKKNDLESLRRFRDDDRDIFTGDNGPPFSIGELVRYTLLRETLN